MGTVAMPGIGLDRTQQQRDAALVRANEVRHYRMELKAALKAREVAFVDVLCSADWQVKTMHTLTLLLATPKVGRVKAGKILKAAQVPPTRQVAMLTEDQRRRLITEVSRPAAG